MSDDTSEYDFQFSGMKVSEIWDSDLKPWTGALC